MGKKAKQKTLVSDALAAESARFYYGDDAQTLHEIRAAMLEHGQPISISNVRRWLRDNMQDGRVERVIVRRPNAIGAVRPIAAYVMK